MPFFSEEKLGSKCPFIIVRIIPSISGGDFYATATTDRILLGPVFQNVINHTIILQTETFETSLAK